MGILNQIGLTSNDENLVESGQGKINARTIEVGNTVIAIDNIGSIKIIEGKKDHTMTISGCVIVLFGLMIMGSMSKLFGLAVVAVGMFVAIRAFLNKIDLILSIGTSDGGRTIIVSKNRQFLESVCQFIRDKIDTKNQSTATFNITNSQLDGVIAIGAGAQAMQQTQWGEQNG